MAYGLLFLVVVAVVAVLWGIAVHNRLVALRLRIRNAFSQIDVQLQRRYDLIPSLVETAKAYMRHENETLEAVIAARNQAAQAAKEAREAPSAATLGALQGAESVLGGLLTRFFALAESYPDLKANQNMLQLHEELTSTENRIAFARQSYNDTVTEYNIQREVFPNSLIASSLNFRAEEVWKSDADTTIRQRVPLGF